MYKRQAIWGCRVFGVFCIGVDFSECAVEASRIYIPEYEMCIRDSFYTISDDGSKLYIDDKLIVDNDGGHSVRRAEGKVALEKGYHRCV